MAEASRNGPAGRNLSDSTRAPEDPMLEPQLDLPELPKSSTATGNPTLNRSAEAVGHTVGTAVAGVRRLPQQIDKLRSRIHLVPRRERAAETISDIRESAEQAANEWRQFAEESAVELKQRAELYTDELSERTSRGWQDLRCRAEHRILTLRRQARRWIASARSWEAEQPLYVIGACAAAAFVAGVMVTVWRSNHRA